MVVLTMMMSMFIYMLTGVVCMVWFSTVVPMFMNYNPLIIWALWPAYLPSLIFRTIGKLDIESTIISIINHLKEQFELFVKLYKD